MSKGKVIYHVRTEIFGEQEFFFDSKGKLLSFWDCNDAVFREEYMSPLFKKLGIKVDSGDYRDPKFWPKIKKELIALGATEDDFPLE